MASVVAKKQILKTSLCDMLEIEYPIVLAGMGSRGLRRSPRLHDVRSMSRSGSVGIGSRKAGRGSCRCD